MNRRYLWAFLILMVAYLTLTFTLPTDPEVLKRYDINQGQARMLNLTIVVPLTIIYFSALYGFLRFKAYADSVIDTKEGEPFKNLSYGLMLFAFSLPVTSIFSSVINYMEHTNNSLLAEVTIARNYLALIFSFIAFMLIARGANGLLATLKDKKVKDFPVLRLAGPIILASIYSWLVTTQPQDTGSDPTYFMPNILVLLTLAVPYVYMWCVGIKAAHNLHTYKNRVRGIIYKKSIDYLSRGIAAIILVSIMIQLITTLSEKLNRLNLTPLLLVIYLLLILYAVGYGFVARSAKKLKQIEEV